MPGLLEDQVIVTEGPELTLHLAPLAEGQVRALPAWEAWDSVQDAAVPPSPWLCTTLTPPHPTPPPRQVYAP